MGAALQAGLILAQKQGKPPVFTIKNVNSHSLGVVGVDPQTGRRRNGMLIPRNTPLPVTAKRTFRTRKENQRSILVQIVEGESPSADDCTQIGKCSVRHLPDNLPAQSPVDVLFHYEPNGRLESPRHRARRRSPSRHRNRPRKQPLQGTSRRLAEIHLRPGADGLSMRGAGCHWHLASASMEKGKTVGCHCWLAQQCFSRISALLGKPAVAPNWHSSSFY